MNTLTIPLPLPTLNEVVAASKAHWSRYARSKRSSTTMVEALARSERIKPITGPVRLSFQWYPKDRRIDLDNLAAGGCKGICDGLVQAGVLPDDSQKWVRGLAHELHDPDGNPRVIVTWEPAV
jgi:Holliday junction resolvase RusA-like endonuclease